MDDIFGENDVLTKREFVLFIVDGKIVGLILFFPYNRAHPAIIENDKNQIWQKSNEIIKVKICVDRLWVAPDYRRKGKKTPFKTRRLKPT